MKRHRRGIFRHIAERDYAAGAADNCEWEGDLRRQGERRSDSAPLNDEDA